MFQALNQNNQIINLLLYTPEEISKMTTFHFVCPDCMEPVLLKRGDIKVAHFAHTSSCKASKLSPKETQSHLIGKSLLYQELSKYTFVHIEYYFSRIKQRADLFVADPINQIIEFQCSTIRHLEIIERTQGYKEVGYPVRWILHHSHLPKHRQRIGIVKLSHFLESCLIHHHNGLASLLFLDEQTKAMTCYLIHERIQMNQYIVEVITLNKVSFQMILGQPKYSMLDEKCKSDLLVRHQKKLIHNLYRYPMQQSPMFHRLSVKWRLTASTIPSYIGMISIFPHSLGKDHDWQFQVVNFILTMDNLDKESPEHITNSYLTSLPARTIDCFDNRFMISLYITFLQSHRLPKKHLSRSSKDSHYGLLWYRFQTLAKPSKD